MQTFGISKTLEEIFVFALHLIQVFFNLQLNIANPTSIPSHYSSTDYMFLERYQFLRNPAL